VDFVSMRDRRAQEEVTAALKAATADDPWGVTVAPMSRFGVVELARGQLRAPLAEVLCYEDGTLSAETLALSLLRGIERESRSARGRVVAAFASGEVCDWLESDVIAWRSALEARLGTRWELRRVAGAPRGQWHVEAL
jgi:Ribonuclease G/E